jgi:hypothetical protein
MGIVTVYDRDRDIVYQRKQTVVGGTYIPGYDEIPAADQTWIKWVVYQFGGGPK